MPTGLVYLRSLFTFQCTDDNGGWLNGEQVAPTATALGYGTWYAASIDRSMNLHVHVYLSATHAVTRSLKMARTEHAVKLLLHTDDIPFTNVRYM